MEKCKLGIKTKDCPIKKTLAKNVKNLECALKIVSEGDKLDKMFEAQRWIEERMIKLSKLQIKDKEKWTKEFILACHSELDELLSEINWKMHKTKSKRVKLTSIVEEISDIMIYTINFALLWGISPNALAGNVLRKNAFNRRRFL